MDWHVNRQTCRLCGESIDNDRPKVIDMPQVGGGSVGVGWVHVSCAQEAARQDRGASTTSGIVFPSRAWAGKQPGGTR